MLKIIDNQPVNLLPTPVDPCFIGDGKKYCMLVNTGDDILLQVKHKENDRLQQLCDPEFTGQAEFPISNESFDGDASGWTLGSGWLYHYNNVQCIYGTSQSLTQSGLSFVSGSTYDITVYFSGGTSGSLTAEIGSGMGYTQSMGGRTASGGVYTFRITIASNETSFSIHPTIDYDGYIDEVNITTVSSCWTYDTTWIYVGDCGLSHIPLPGNTTTLEQSYDLSYSNLTGNSSGIVKISVSNMTAGTVTVSDFVIGDLYTISENGESRYVIYAIGANFSSTLILTPTEDFDGCINYVKLYPANGTPLGVVRSVTTDVDGNETYMDVITNIEALTNRSIDGSGIWNINLNNDGLLETEGCYQICLYDEYAESLTDEVELSPDVLLNNQPSWTNYNIANSSVLVTGGQFQQIVLANGYAESYIACTYNYPHTSSIGVYQIYYEIETGTLDSIGKIELRIISPDGSVDGQYVVLKSANIFENTTHSGMITIPSLNSGLYSDQIGFGFYVDGGLAGEENYIKSASLKLVNYYNNMEDFTYCSNKICIQDSHECTKLVVGDFVHPRQSFGESIEALGFNFNSHFRLQQRLRMLKFNPIYPIDSSDYEYSSGTRSLTYAKREKYYDTLMDYMGETEHDTLSAQILCDTFTVDGVQYYVRPEEYKPEWEKSGSQRLAQSRILMRKSDGAIYRTNI